MKLDKPTLEAVASLWGSQEFIRFCASLEHELKKTDISLRSCTRDSFERMQGRATILAEILSNLASAKDRLYTLNTKK